MIGLVLSLALLGAEPHVLAARPLPRGTVITADIVDSQGADLSGYLGKQLRRPVFAGKPILASDLAAPDAVARQSNVTVAFRKRGLTLSLPGRAMRAGAVGDVVTVLIDGRRRPVRAVVTGPGEVEIGR
ncbi:flagellar basal body P-ring formation chaperone FlgA [Parvularcula oceani]|uniref:flagellar basal body P-ring formation chaperone FlgA n=1 Tax=Parvularcula oceani TaxID=1247963 RepID=UPI0004E13103|nr:flagellar basal body P-ring formation chaperone FlgA [Parvularcula oceani]